MKAQNLTGEMKRLAFETTKLKMEAQAVVRSAERIQAKASERIKLTEQHLKQARSEKERIAAEADYLRATQDRHAALVCSSAAAKHVNTLSGG